MRSAPVWKCVCARSPCDGLDCGVYLPGQQPRRPAARKMTDEARARAWNTRRRLQSQKAQPHD